MNIVYKKCIRKHDLLYCRTEKMIFQRNNRVLQLSTDLVECLVSRNLSALKIIPECIRKYVYFIVGPRR